MAETTVTSINGPTAEQQSAAAEAEARLQALLAMGDVNQANAATGVYGDTGTGKSVLVDTAAEYCYRRYGKITRIVCADLGGFGNKRLRLIRLGIVQVYNPLNHIEPFETMEDLSRGWWPETILDPYTGAAARDVRLVPPERTQWVVYCQKDHPMFTTELKSQLSGFQRQCPVCKGGVVTAQTWGRVEEQVVRSGAIKSVGLYGFDSGTSLADWAMEDMSDRAARSDPNAKDGNNLSATGARVLSGKYAFGANTQPHYGFAQNAVRRWIKNSRLIPRQVMPAVWTFLEDRGSDSDKNISVFGPKIPGTAKTHVVPSWLGNCLYATKETNERGEDEHRLYLVNHTDRNSNVPHLAKTRAEPGTFGVAFLADVDPVTKQKLPAFTRFSLAYFFDVLDSSLVNTAKQDAEEFPDAPAFRPIDLSTEEVETVGAPVVVPAVAATARVMPQAPVMARQMAAAPAAPVAAPAKPQPPTATPPQPPAKPPVAAAPTAPVSTPPVVAAPAAPAAVTAGPVAAPTAPPGPRPVTPPAAGRPPTPPAVGPRRGAVPPPPGAPRKPA